MEVLNYTFATDNLLVLSVKGDKKILIIAARWHNTLWELVMIEQGESKVVA